MYNIRSGAFDDKYMISYFMAIVIFDLSLIVCEIFWKQEKCQQKSDFENEGQGQGQGQGQGLWTEFASFGWK